MDGNLPHLIVQRSFVLWQTVTLTRSSNVEKTAAVTLILRLTLFDSFLLLEKRKNRDERDVKRNISQK